MDYKFENGDRVKFVVLNIQKITNEFIFEVTFYPLKGSRHSTKSYGERLYLMVKKLLVLITNKSTERIAETHTNAHKDRYNLIVGQIKTKQLELSGITEEDPKHKSLSNELISYKLIADKLKKLL